MAKPLKTATSPGTAIPAQPLDTDLLTVFCRVAEASNFSRAALHLGVAQPIVTRKIRKLEEDLGVNLFIRTNRGCTLTQEGELLYSKAAGILMQLTHLKDEVSTSHDRISGSISVGVPIAAGMLLAPHLMLAVAARWPLLRVELLETVSRNLLAGVLNRDISLALLYDPPVDADVIARPLLMERLHLIGPPRAAAQLAAMKKATVHHMAELPLVLPIRSQIIRVLLEDAFAEEGLPLAPRYEANSTMLLKSMVSQGLGFGITSQVSTADDVAAGKLSAVPLADKGMSLTLTLVTTREYSRLRAVQMMSGLIASEVERLVKSGLWPGSPRLL